MDDNKTYSTSLNDIFMLYKVKITCTKIFERGSTGPPGSAPDGDHVVPATKETDSREQESETVTPVANEVDHKELEKGDKFDVYSDSLTTTHSKRKATEVARMKIKKWLNPKETFLIGECRGLRMMMSVMT